MEEFLGQKRRRQLFLSLKEPAAEVRSFQGYDYWATATTTTTATGVRQSSRLLLTASGRVGRSTESSEESTTSNPHIMNQINSHIPVVEHETSVVYQPSEYPASTTTAVIILWHVLFLYQWNKRKRRKRLNVDYRTLVQKKRYYRLWIALCSHPASKGGGMFGRPGRQQQQTPHSLPTTSFEQLHSSRTIEMGHADSADSSSSRYNWTALWIQRFASNPILIRLGDMSKYLLWLCFQGDLSGLPLLIYNSHILWSCRAIEENYNSSQMHWNYTRILICWGVLSFGMELLLSHVLLRRILTLTTGLVTQLPPENSTLMQTIRPKILQRSMASPATISATVLLVFHIRYPYVPVPILPFVNNLFFLDEAPTVCYILCVTILTLLSQHCHTVLGVVFGGIVGLCWSMGVIDFLQEPHWNIVFVLGCLILTLLSLRANKYYGKWFPCVEHVSWDEQGRFLVQNERGQWLPENDDDGVEEESSSSSEDDDDERSLQDTVASAFPTSEDDEIYGLRLAEDDDLESSMINMNDRVSRPSGMRSRPTASSAR